MADAAAYAAGALASAGVTKKLKEMSNADLACWLKEAGVHQSVIDKVDADVDGRPRACIMQPRACIMQQIWVLQARLQRACMGFA